MPPTPRPGTTVQVPVPGVPSEQQATNWALQSGKLIGAVLMVVLVMWFLKFLFASVQVRIIATGIIFLFIGYMIWGR
jgi:hypothetical protein